MTKPIAVLGSGVVGEVLANGFLRYGEQVVRGTREPAKLAAWQQQAGERARVATFGDAVGVADVVVLAVKGTAAKACLESIGAEALRGKIVIDATNPIADAPPVQGVLQFFTGPNDSLMEQLQSAYPDARFVKAFSCVGNAHMIQPDFGPTKPTMFICGNDEAAKAKVASLIERFGWDVADMGAVQAARAIEPLCMLWCIPGITRGQWNHAFALLRR